jgi:hypothetical protein
MKLAWLGKEGRVCKWRYLLYHTGTTTTALGFAGGKID